MRYLSVLMVGEPGVGKTTLSKRISGVLSYFAPVSRRGLLEEFAQAHPRDARSERIAAMFQTGALLDDATLESVVREQLAVQTQAGLITPYTGSADPKAQYLLHDGTIRTVAQARQFHDLFHVLEVWYFDTADMPKTELARLLQERGTSVEDTPQKIAQRHEQFVRKTKPLLRFYEEKGVPIVPLDTWKEPHDMERNKLLTYLSAERRALSHLPAPMSLPYVYDQLPGW